MILPEVVRVFVLKRLAWHGWAVDIWVSRYLGIVGGGKRLRKSRHSSIAHDVFSAQVEVTSIIPTLQH